MNKDIYEYMVIFFVGALRYRNIDIISDRPTFNGYWWSYWEAMESILETVDIEYE